MQQIVNCMCGNFYRDDHLSDDSITNDDFVPPFTDICVEEEVMCLLQLYI